MSKKKYTSPSLRALKYFGRSNPELRMDCRVAYAPRNDESVLAFTRITPNQNGNVLFFILIAIALLGLLTVTMSRSGSNSNDTGSFEQNQIAASDILSYAKSIENAVQSLLARGCSENEISFENSTVAGYTNPNSPADKSCHVFDVAGAGMTYTLPNENWLDSSKNSLTSYREWVFAGQVTIGDVGEERCGGECADLIVYLPFLKRDTCASINSRLKQTVSLDSDEGIQDLGPNSGDFFQGTYVNNSGYVGNQNIELLEQHSACIYRGHQNNFAFYHVLIAR